MMPFVHSPLHPDFSNHLILRIELICFKIELIQICINSKLDMR